MSEVPKSHPRYESLRLREVIVAGVEEGVTSVHGLLAHGRGEAFDYLLGERTRRFAKKATRAAAAMLLTADRPVVSVNGNAAALVAGELVFLAELIGAPLEVNIFHSSKNRERAIRNRLTSFGAKQVLMPDNITTLPGIDSNRRYAHPKGILRADVVFVPLEDGDRCEALVKAGKKVIAVDLNPLSRTARKAHITIVDNVIRALPNLLKQVDQLRKKPDSQLQTVVKEYRQRDELKEAVQTVRGK